MIHAQRTLVVRCPDWPLSALGMTPADPAAVLAAGRVVAASAAARSAGVAVGQRRREAQARCPVVVVLDRDEAAEARRFEAVAAAPADEGAPDLPASQDPSPEGRSPDDTASGDPA